LGVQRGLYPKILLDINQRGSGTQQRHEEQIPRTVLPGTIRFRLANGHLVTGCPACAGRSRNAYGVAMVVGAAVRRCSPHAGEVGAQSDFKGIREGARRVGGVETPVEDNVKRNNVERRNVGTRQLHKLTYQLLNFVTLHFFSVGKTTGQRFERDGN